MAAVAAIHMARRGRFFGPAVQSKQRRWPPHMHDAERTVGSGSFSGPGCIGGNDDGGSCVLVLMRLHVPGRSIIDS